MRRGPAAARLAVGLLGLTLPGCADADETAHDPRVAFVETHCITCHGPQRQRGELRLDTLPYELTERMSRDRWQQALELIADGSMPPDDAPSRPTQAERDAVVALLRADLDAAEARAPVGGSLLRRLNRVELLNTVRDLFGIRGIDLPKSFPEDISDLPFDTMPEGLALSAAQVDACLELAADIAERMVYMPPARPVTSESDLDAWSQERSVWTRDGDATGMYLSGVNNAGWSGAIWDRAFSAPTSGTYRVDILASAEGEAGADGEPLRLGFYALSPWDYYRPESANRVGLPRVGSLEVRALEPELLTCTVELEQGETFHVYCENRLPPGDRPGALNRLDLTNLFMAAVRDPRPTVRVERMTITGPVGPLTRHTAFVGGPRPSADEDALGAVLLPLAERAYRRPPSEREQLELMEPVLQHARETRSPELALRFGIRRLLVAPAFLYLDARPGTLDGYALASRLSYFLWSSMPDGELLELAATGRLAEPDVLRGQARRLLAHPKGQRFVRDFTGQWLGNRQLATLMVCDVRHVWNELLRYGYIRSTELFFDEVLRENRSIRAFLDSDFTYANVPMQMVWGVPGEHPAMDKLASDQTQSHIQPEPERLDLTALPDGTPPHVAKRGGILGLPGVLTLTGDGVESSPIRRGVWVLDNLYGTPSPPQPDDVPALAPDTSGTASLRERLAAHQDSPSCASCHEQIDPLGFALENYDAAGNWREAYVVDEGARPAMPVDPTGVLPDGSALAGPDDVKGHLLTHAGMFTRCLATKLLEYGTGRRMSVGDARVVERMVRDEPPDGYGFRELIETLVDSEVFRTR